MDLVFDITGSHIAELDDSDLRTLVARLCEAELRRSGLPVSAVTAGGDQNAADGGLDVRVNLPASTAMGGFIPRPATGFQVKVPDMPRHAILEEMCPNGILRPVIQQLASASGAYIIVSAQGSTADSALQSRHDAMRGAVATLEDPSTLTLDFYDRERLASWVREHHGLVSWVRERIGQPIRGWRPYANWALPSENVDARYLVDGKNRLHDERSPREGGLPVEQGIRRIREVLAQPRGTVRLVGLSGTGKTRLVQAVFDARVGDLALDPTLAFYTDLADEPDPSPRDLLLRLAQDRQRAIVVVDNCPPETHRDLTAICIRQESIISLITIEYDVGDDDPEGTEVFRLEPASNEVIVNLLECQAPHISQVDRRHIAEASGGNARIALALARTVTRGESVANLKDTELFKRLFYQRQAPNDLLLRAAQACSIVYSFNGVVLEGETAELPLLAELVGLTTAELYRCVAELRSRDLVQPRGQWRAVLPQALANRLARQALEEIVPGRLSATIVEKGPDRLLQSFSRRLGYLHDSDVAQNIVRGWLSPGGLLSNISQLTSLGITILQNVAPVDPEAILDALESAAIGNDATSLFDHSNRGHSIWGSLLRSLAYESHSFEKAALLLARFVTHEQPSHMDASAGSLFTELFHLYLSGTHASVEQRLRVIDTLVGSEDAASQARGIEAIDALLEAWHFTSSHHFEFGARPRDHGWHPKTNIELVEWYRAALSYAQRWALLNGPLRDKVRSILAKQFRSLWTRAGILDELESMAHALAAQDFWSDGWIAIRNTISFDANAMPPDHVDRLRTLEVALRPNGLLQKARAYVLTQSSWSLDIADGEPCEEGDAEGANFERADEITEMLGREIATNRGALDALLPNLVRNEVARVSQFGKGLATGADQLPALWGRLVEAVGKTKESERNIDVLRGFLSGAYARDTEVTAGFLEAAVDNSILGPWFPILQTSINIDEEGAKRLERALRIGLAPSWTYQYLSMGRATDPIPTSILRRLILGIASLPKGYAVAVKILRMRLFSLKISGGTLEDELALCGRELMRRYTFDQPREMLDHELGIIVDACFRGDTSAEDATFICRQLKAALVGHRTSAYHYKMLIASLFRTQPTISLNEFLGDHPQGTIHSGIYSFDSTPRNPLDEVSPESLIAWAQIDPPARFPQLAAAIIPFMNGETKGTTVWTPTALQILNLSPDRIAVLTRFRSQFMPNGWSGSLANILESRRLLLRALLSYSDPAVVSWARGQDAELGRWAERERLQEGLREQRIDQSFE